MRGRGGCSMDEQFFSYRLTAARVTIEYAFGHLKGRFGLLRREVDVCQKDLPFVIYSCFVLHTICEIQKDKIPDLSVQAAVQYDQWRLMLLGILGNAPQRK